MNGKHERRQVAEKSQPEQQRGVGIDAQREPARVDVRSEGLLEPGWLKLTYQTGRERYQLESNPQSEKHRPHRHAKLYPPPPGLMHGKRQQRCEKDDLHEGVSEGLNSAEVQ